MAQESSNLSTFEKSKIVTQALLEAVKAVIIVPICAFLLATVFAFIIALTHLFELGEYGAWLGPIFALYATYAGIVIGPVVWWRVSAKRLGVSRKTNTIGTTAVSSFFALVLLFVLWGEQAITNPPHLDDVSDDGRYILAASTGPDSSSLYKIDTTSGIATLLPTTWQRRAVSYAALSPDSSQIAFAHSDDEKKYSIMLMDIDGKDSHPLLNQGGNDSWPRFSRDGRTIYFIRTAGNAFDLFSSTLDGKNVTQLTHQRYTFKLGPYLRAAPVLSSDGKQLLFTTDESLQLCSLASANQQPNNLAFQLPNAPPSRMYVSAYFSPDDNGILFMAASEGKGGYAYNTYHLELASRNVRKLTENNGYASDFRLSASGKKAVFLKWKLSRFQKLPRNFQLELMDIQSGRVMPVSFKGLPE